jgi:CMP-N-acetylneuraminic acid synthetase
MKILGVIPARGGSKGVPRKNIKILGDLPLIVYTIRAALNSNISRLIVSTEDEEIAEVSLKYGAEVPFKRPFELSQDNSKSIDVAINGLIEAEKFFKEQYDAIMMLQPTTPFRITDDINNSIEMFLNDSEADSVISVVDVEGHHPARMKFINNNVLIDPVFCENYENQNRQELEPMFIRNGAIYLTKRRTLLQGSFKGYKSLAYKMPSNRSINIDNQNDFDYAKWLLQKSV